MEAITTEDVTLYHQALPRLEVLLNKFADAIAPLLDASPPDINKFHNSGLKGKVKELSSVSLLVKTGMTNAHIIICLSFFCLLCI